MKRLNHLFEKVIDIDNIRLADARARRSKPHSYGVMVHDKNKDANLERLRAELCNHTFRTSDYTTFEIFEPKRRVIYRLPYYPDRILHHAIMNILEPVWVSVFNSHTYSCIKERGIHKCANDVRAALKENPAGTRYCLKLDVRHFYPSIDHGILKSIVRRKIKDADLLAVLDESSIRSMRTRMANQGAAFPSAIIFRNISQTFIWHISTIGLSRKKAKRCISVMRMTSWCFPIQRNICTH